MRFWITFCAIVVAFPLVASANPKLLQQHCADCHGGVEPEGEFAIATLGTTPSRDTLKLWLNTLDRVKAGEMPPEDDSTLSSEDRKNLTAYLRQSLERFSQSSTESRPNFRPRRMNNREFENSIREVLMIEDVGTNLPTDNLIGDSRKHGFDTDAETLGFSNFHLEQYIRSVRNIVDATILSGDRPQTRRYEIQPNEIFESTTSQNIRRRERFGTKQHFDFLDPRRFAYFKKLKEVPATGFYRINIRCVGKDRGIYDAEDTGIYEDDPIQLKLVMGDRQRTFDLPDETVKEIEVTEWLAAGTRVQLQNPTDGLRLIGNGNFKFQNRITPKYLKKNDPDRYRELVATFPATRNGRKRKPDDWHNWVDYWMGPRPRILGVVVEGPIFESWPTERQATLIGETPTAEQALTVLEPIAERAWRRPVQAGELADIVS